MKLWAYHIAANKLRTTHILNIKTESPTVKTFTFKDQQCGRAKPGQFLMLWIPSVDEIPLSILDAKENGMVSVAVQKVGEATSALHDKRIGELIGVRGPLGNSFTSKEGRILMVSGGTGTAQILFLADRLASKTAKLVFLLGAKTREELLFMNKSKRTLGGEKTQLIAKGDYTSKVEINKEDEIGRLADAIDQMREEIGEKQSELNRQRDEYQTLFERVPCIITVQDRNYKLIRYNKEFYEKFKPKPGDHCYAAYKGRKEKCVICPVERTFEDGLSHFSEERGVGKDGTSTHWIVNTSPIKDEQGEIVAAMEMSLDVTQTKLLEQELEKSEKNGQIFKSLPLPASRKKI